MQPFKQGLNQINRELDLTCCDSTLHYHLVNRVNLIKILLLQLEQKILHHFSPEHNLSRNQTFNSCCTSLLHN